MSRRAAALLAAVLLVSSFVSVQAATGVAADSVIGEPIAVEPAVAISSGPAIVSLVPERVLETRSGLSTGDGDGAGGGRVAAGGVVEVPVLGRAGVPGSGVSAVVVNVTAVNPSGRGFLTVFPCDEVPTASSLNFAAAGAVVANELVAKVSSSGSVCVFTSAETHLLVDVVGYALEGSAYVSLVPERVLETRSGLSTGDGDGAGGGRVAAGGVVEVPVLGRAGVPGSGVSAVVVNVTAVNPSGRGFLTVFPCDEVPTASSLNFAAAGAVVANELVAKVSSSGSVCVFTSAETHLLVDVVGYALEGSAYVSLVPERVLETRSGLSTGDGDGAGGGRVAAGGVVEVPVLGRAGVPGSGVSAVVVNVTAVNPSGRGFLTVFPCDEVPTASSLNFAAAGAVVANELVAKVSSSGSVCVFTSAETHLLVDVVGHLPEADPVDDARIDTFVYEAGWHLEPPEVFFDDDDQSATVRLIHLDAAGVPTGEPVPSGVELVRPTSIFPISQPSPGVFEIDGGEIIDGEYAGVRVPGVPDPLRLPVSGARLRDGVIVVPAEQVVFPAPGTSDPGGTAPFTAAELIERADDTSAPNVIPNVLRAPAPPTGSIIVGAGVYGRIVERPGLPALERDGLALVSVELIPPGDVFRAVDFELDYGSLYDAGMLGSELNRTDCFGYEGECPDPESFGPDPAARRSAAPGDDSVRRAPDIQTRSLLGGCDGDVALQIGEIKGVVTNSIRPTGGISPNYEIRTEDGETVFDLLGVDITLGVTGGISAGVEGKLRMALGGNVTCDLGDLAGPEFPVPGPLGLVFTGLIQFGREITGEIKVAGPGEVGFSAQCGLTAEKLVGLRFLFDSGSSEVIDEGAGFTSACPTSAGILGPGAQGQGLAAEFEAKVGAFLVPKAGIRIGGKVMSYIGTLTGDSGLGAVTPLQLAAGGEVALTMETASNVVNNQSGKTGLKAKLVASVAVALDDLQSFLRESLGFNISIPAPTLEFSGPEFGIFDASSTGTTPSYQVDGDATSAPNGLVLAPDEQAEVRFATPTTTGLVNLPVGNEFHVFDLTDGTLDENTDWVFAKTGSSAATGSFTMTSELCSGEYQEKRTFGVLGSFGFNDESGLIPMWVGKFEAQCNRALGFEERLLSNRPGVNQENRGGSSVEVTRGDRIASVYMTQIGHDDELWELIEADGANTPQLSVSPANGTFTEDEVLVQVELVCEDDEDTEGTAVFRARTNGELQQAELTVDYTCSPNWIEVFIGEAQVGSVIEVNTGGDEVDVWTAQSTRVGRSELAVFPSGGSLDADDNEWFTIATSDRRTDECGESHPFRTETLQIETNTRGTETVVVRFPPIEPPADEEGEGEGDSCDEEEGPGGPPDEEEEEDPGDGPGGPGGGQGDPHMISFDGLRYDAQVLGEYEYAATGDGSIRIVARHDRSTGGPGQIFGATSIVAASVEIDGTEVEVYARPVRETRVDDEVVDIEDGVPFSSGSVSIRLDGEVLTVSGPGVLVEIETRGGLGDGILDVMVTPRGASFRGLLGINDGDSSNDLTPRVPFDAPPITIGQARAHGVDLYRFTDSWRITDLELSPFERSSAIFAQPNPPVIGSELLEPYRQQALNEVAGIGELCDGTLSAGSYDLDVIALELATGTDPADLVDFTCDFRVTGRVTTELPGGSVIGVANTLIQVDADGLQPCTTRTAPSGNYRCTATPDIAEALGGPGITFPLVASVDVTAPGGSFVAESLGATFDTKPAFGQTAVSDDNDLQLSVDALTVVQLTGTITEFGSPRSVETSFDIEVRDSVGSRLSTRVRGIEPSATGTYSTSFVVPNDTDEVIVEWNRGLIVDPDPSVTFDSLGLGVNTLVFDPVYDPPVANVSGTTLVNGLVPDQVRVVVRADLPSGDVFDRRFVDRPDPQTGTYGATLRLPVETTSAEVSVELLDGLVSPATTTLAAPAAGPNPIELDFIVDAPVLAVSGALLENDDVIPTTIDLAVAATRTGGAVEERTVPINTDSNGDYEFVIGLPDDTESVTIIAPIGLPVDHPSITVSQPPVGRTAVEFDANPQYPVVELVGTMTGGGLPVTDSTRIDIESTGPNPVSLSQFVTPDHLGRFEIVVPFPAETTGAMVTARVGFDSSDWVTTSLVDLEPGRQEITFDPSFDAVGVLMTGTLAVRGVPPIAPVTITLRGLDSIGEVAGGVSRSAIPDALGGFEIVALFPTEVVALRTSAHLGDFTVGRDWQTFSGLTVGANTIADVMFDHDPPSVALSGVFTNDGAAITGVKSFELRIDYLDEAGGLAVTTVDEPVFLSIEDGSYSFEVDLPPTAQRVDVTADVTPDPAVAPTITIDPVEPGVNAATFSADLSQPAAIALTSTFSVATVPFTGATDVRYRYFDADDVQIGVRSHDTIEFTPNASGVHTESFELPPETRRVEFAWFATDGPTYTSFDVAPGDNPIDYTVDVPATSLTVSGRLTDDGVPFTSPTGFRVETRNTLAGASGRVDVENVDVTPDGNGDFTFSLPFSPDRKLLQLRWDDEFGGDEYDIPLTTGANDIPFDVDVGTIENQRILVEGNALVGGEAYPGEIRFTLRPIRLSGSSFPVTFTETPDAATGAYSFEYIPTQPIRGARVFSDVGGGDLIVDPINPTGDTTLDYDISLDGRLISVSGTATSASPLGAVIVQFVDPAEDRRRTSRVFPDSGTGEYAASILWNGMPDELLIGVSPGGFDEDGIFLDDPVDTSSAVTEVVDFDVDLTPPELVLSGNVTQNGAPRTDSFPVRVEWAADDPFQAGDWTDIEFARPDASGDYTLEVTGPVRADRVTATALLPASSNTATVDPLVIGSNPVPLDLVVTSQSVSVSGIVADGPEVPWYPIPVSVTALDGSDAGFTVSSDVGLDGAGRYELDADLATDTTSVEVTVDLNGPSWLGEPVSSALIFTSTFAVAPPQTDLTFDVASNRLDVTGTAVTVDGVARDEGFEVTADLYAGGTAGTLLDTVQAFGFADDGELEIGLALPATTDAVVLTTSLAGVAPITFTGLGSGQNQRTVDVVTDSFRLVTIDGVLALNGATPPIGVQTEFGVQAYRFDTDRADGTLRSIWFGPNRFNYTGADGTGVRVVRVPPEAEFVVVEARFYSGTGLQHRRVLDLRGSTGAINFTLDIDDRPDTIRFGGAATIDPASACPAAGASFGFRAEVRGYLGDPADGATPPPTSLLDTLVIGESSVIGVDGVERNWDLPVAVPAGITHVDVVVDTDDIEDPATAQLAITTAPVAVTGGIEVAVVDLEAGCVT